jgi:hypothetical protein
MEALSTPEMLSLRGGASSVTVISSGNVHTAVSTSEIGVLSRSQPDICHILQLAEAKGGIQLFKHILQLAEAKAGIQLCKF